MDCPLITVFIPTYKRPHLLKNAICSALNQTYKNLQVIVCDNASNDETSQVVAEIAKKDPRLHYICHPKNIGMLANYAFGFSQAKTTFFSFLSDDDILLPCFCETALMGFSQYPNIAFFACSTVSLSKEGGVICVPLDIWPREGCFSPEEGVVELIGKYPVPTTVLFRKEAVASVKIDFDNPIGWDCDLLIQLAGQFPFAISKKRCGVFIHHENSFSGSQDTLASLDAICRLMLRVRDFSWMKEEIKSSVNAQLQMAIYNNSFASILSDFSFKQFKKARKTCLYLLMHHPIRIKVVFYWIQTFMPAVFLRRKKTAGTPFWDGFEEYRTLVHGL